MTILEKCNQILNDKNEHLLPENLKTGEICLGVEGTFTSDADAETKDIVAGKSGYVNGNKVTGTLAVKDNGIDVSVQNTSGILTEDGLVVSGNFENFTDGMVVNNTQTIKSQLALATLSGLLGLTPDKLKNGVTICGVEGTVIELIGEEIVVTPGASGQSITPSEGKNAITSVSVNGDSNLIPSNIKSGVTIFGVEGTYDGPIKTISSDEIADIGMKAITLQTALTELSILTAEQTLSALGYTTTTENDVITFNINSIGVYSIDSQDIVRNEQGEQVYPELEIPVP